eukprot:gene19121-21038_t
MASVRKIAVSSNCKVKIVKWLVKQGQDIQKDTNLAIYVYCDTKDKVNNFITERKLKSRFDGKVSQILYRINVEIPAGSPVVAILEEEHCKHTVVMKDMCCQCGTDLRLEKGIPGTFIEPVAAEVPMVHNIPELKVSLEEAEEIARSDEKKLLKSKKLALVVDLDQTLIHTTHEAIPQDLQDVFHFRLPDQPIEYHTKFRPGAKCFLETASNMYELHIFTMGSRLYAHTIARHLDPDEKLFAHRIRSRDECMDGFSKSKDLRALFPCGDHMVCIIDDREDVWNFAPNLITVKPYRFFSGTGDINDPFANANKENAEEGNTTVECSKPNEEDRSNPNKVPEVGEESPAADKTDRVVATAEGLLEGNVNKEKVDEKMETEKTMPEKSEQSSASLLHDLDDYLYYLEEILEKVHRTFYATFDKIKLKGGLAKQDPEISKFCTANTLNPDTRAIVPALRKETLAGARVVFTGIIPRSIALTKSLPYRTAIELGASVTEEIVTRKSSGKRVSPSQYSTHVVAARLGTEKAYKAARLSHVKLVNPDWLWCCAQRWEWVEEKLFPVVNRESSNGTNTPEASGRSTPVVGVVAGGSDRGNGSTKTSRVASISKADKELLHKSAEEIMLDTMITTTFSKDELDEMDKEVEEYMLSDKDDDDDNDYLGSISGSSSRQSNASSSRTNSSRSSSSSSNSSSKPVSLKRKFESAPLQNDVMSKSSRNGFEVSQNDVGRESMNTFDSNSSVSSEEDSNGSGSEDDIAALLERRISSGSPL